MLFIGWLILSFLNKEVLFCLYSLEAGALELIVKVYDRKNHLSLAVAVQRLLSINMTGL